MAGRWTKANPPKRPGAYTNFVSKPQLRIDPPLSGIVALPVVATWGPDSEVVEVDSIGQYVSIFGDDTTSAGYKAAYQTFKGEGIEGRGGAARCLIYRLVGGDAAAASLDLANTAGTPVTDAVVVEGIYLGSYGNNLSVALVANAAESATKQDLIVYLDGSEVERFTFTTADLATLEAAVATSGFIKVTVNDDTDPLDEVSTATALTGGDDDDAGVGAGEWSDSLEALATKRFAVFCPFDLTDEAIQDSIRTWAADEEIGHNVKGKRFITVLGCTSPIGDLAQAVERAGDLNSPDVVVVGGFTVSDSKIVDGNGDPEVLSPSLFAPRVAGVIAATGDNGSVTFSRFTDASLVTGLSSDADFVTASEAGILTLAEDSNIAAPVRIEQGVTTYQDDTEAQPKEIFSSIRYVRIMGSIETAITEFVEGKVIGRLNMSQETREYVLGFSQKLLSGFADRGAVQDNYQVYVSQDPPPSDTDDFINLVYEVTLGRDVKQIRGTIVVG
jgi:hypothetical protein